MNRRRTSGRQNLARARRRAKSASAAPNCARQLRARACTRWLCMPDDEELAPDDRETPRVPEFAAAGAVAAPPRDHLARNQAEASHGVVRAREVADAAAAVDGDAVRILHDGAADRAHVGAVVGPVDLHRVVVAVGDVELAAVHRDRARAGERGRVALVVEDVGLRHRPQDGAVVAEAAERRRRPVGDDEAVAAERERVVWAAERRQARRGGCGSSATQRASAARARQRRETRATDGRSAGGRRSRISRTTSSGNSMASISEARLREGLRERGLRPSIADADGRTLRCRPKK